MLSIKADEWHKYTSIYRLSLDRYRLSPYAKIGLLRMFNVLIWLIETKRANNGAKELQMDDHTFAAVFVFTLGLICGLLPVLFNW